MTGNLPASAPVVVIGGGIMGCSTLYHLAEAGVTDAILLERNKLTSGTTWHSAAQVRALRSSRNLTDLIRHSIELYSRLEAETGQSTGWINKGSLSIATNEERLIHIKRQEALAGLFGIEAKSVSPGEARERWPLMNADDVIGAVWSPGDGRVSPSDLCAALVKGAKAHGCRIFEDTPVTGIVTEGGKVVAVETGAGLIRCDAVAVCSGLWSRKIAGMAGHKAPVWPCEHFYLLTRPIEAITGNLPSLSDHDGHLYIRDEAGGLLVGCFEPMGKPIDPDRLGEDFAFQLLPEDWDHFEPMMLNALHRLPVLEDTPVRMLLNGPESFTTDGSFLLGESAVTRGLFLGCGMNSVGVATGGGAGMALAHCIQHGHPPADLHEADPNRFADCMSDVAVLTARAPEILGRHYEITWPGRSVDTARNLRLTPLHDRFVAEGAHFSQVFGWERPVFFGKSKEPALTFKRPAWHDQVGREVARAHEDVALFDQSTFGKIAVEGPDAERFLERVCANRMARVPGSVIYTAMLNEHGGFESDLTAIRLGEEKHRLYTGAAAINRDLGWLRRNVKDGERVALRDETEDWAVLGVMGPRALEVLHALGGGDLADVGYFRCVDAVVAGVTVLAARLSYVGEAGFEMTCRRGDALALHDALHDAGVRPAGLYAQTSMRIEKRYLAMGHDLDADTTPLDAGLGFAVAWDTEFTGKEALLARRDAPSGRQAVTLLFDDKAAVPLGSEPVLLKGKIVGQTTSAAYGYRVGRPVAIAFIDSNAMSGDSGFSVDIAGEAFEVAVSELAAFDPGGTRMRQRASTS